MYKRYVAFITAALLISGCSTTHTFKPTPGGDKALYASAASKSARDKSEAIENLSNIEVYYPDFERMDEAMLLKLELLYKSNQFAEAQIQADRFISLYPNHPKTPYAYYLRGMCSYNEIMDSARDQKITEEALITFETLQALFPNSEYTNDVNSKIKHIRNILGVKELEVGRFYIQKGNSAAAIGRFQKVLHEYNDTLAAPEAMFRMVESYVNIKSYTEAQRYYELLKASPQNTIWAEKARILLNHKG